KKVGTTTITVTTTNGKTAQCVVTVTKAPILISGVILDKNNVSMMKKENVQLTAAVVPGDTTETYEFVWTSSDNSICTVDQNGMVTGVGVGSAVITVTLKGTTFSATANVEVISDIAVDTSTLDMMLADAKVTITNSALYKKDEAWDLFLTKYEDAIVASKSGNQTLIDQSVIDLCNAYFEIRMIPNEDMLSLS
ncbi:MAG: Ig-like domain-containing protein, partial [Longicatena sp.]